MGTQQQVLVLSANKRRVKSGWTLSRCSHHNRTCAEVNFLGMYFDFGFHDSSSSTTRHPRWLTSLHARPRRPPQKHGHRSRYVKSRRHFGHGLSPLSPSRPTAPSSHTGTAHLPFRVFDGQVQVRGREATEYRSPKVCLQTLALTDAKWARARAGMAGGPSPTVEASPPTASVQTAWIPNSAQAAGAQPAAWRSRRCPAL